MQTDIPELEQNTKLMTSRRYMIALKPDLPELMSKPCIAEIMECLTQYTEIMKQIFPMYHAFKHSILISPPNSEHNNLYIQSYLLSICIIANEQKLHIDFDFNTLKVTANIKKMNDIYLPFSLLLPVEKEIKLTVCKYAPSSTKKYERIPVTLQGISPYHISIFDSCLF